MSRAAVRPAPLRLDAEVRSHTRTVPGHLTAQLIREGGEAMGLELKLSQGPGSSLGVNVTSPIELAKLAAFCGDLGSDYSQADEINFAIHKRGTWMTSVSCRKRRRMPSDPESPEILALLISRRVRSPGRAVEERYQELTALLSPEQGAALRAQLSSLMDAARPRIMRRSGLAESLRGLTEILIDPQVWMTPPGAGHWQMLRYGDATIWRSDRRYFAAITQSGKGAAPDWLIGEPRGIGGAPTWSTAQLGGHMNTVLARQLTELAAAHDAQLELRRAALELTRGPGRAAQPT